jgi:hypothetical protein
VLAHETIEVVLGLLGQHLGQFFGSDIAHGQGRKVQHHLIATEKSRKLIFGTFLDGFAGKYALADPVIDVKISFFQKAMRPFYRIKAIVISHEGLAGFFRNVLLHVDHAIHADGGFGDGIAYIELRMAADGFLDGVDHAWFQQVAVADQAVGKGFRLEVVVKNFGYIDGCVRQILFVFIHVPITCFLPFNGKPRLTFGESAISVQTLQKGFGLLFLVMSFLAADPFEQFEGFLLHFDLQIGQGQVPTDMFIKKRITE